MAKSKSAKSKNKSPSKAKKTAKPKVAKAAAKKGESKAGGARTLPDKSTVLAACKELDRANNRNAQTREGLKEALDLAKERGVDVAMVRLVQRFVKMAKDSPIGAAIKYENFQYYLEVVEFEKMIAPSMFKADEVRSGKKSSAKANGKNGHAPKQPDLKLVPQSGEAEAADAPPVAADDAEERSEEASVH